MSYAVKVGTDGKCAAVEMPENADWRWYAGEIGCDHIEVVRPRGLDEPYVMIADEEGRLRDKPALNPIASWLYKTHEHGQPIVGDVLIVQEEWGEDGAELQGMALEIAEAERALLQCGWEISADPLDKIKIRLAGKAAQVF